MAWALIWFFVAQVSVIHATNCFMVNDLKHKLRWEVTGSNGDCPCSSMLPGGVSASLPPDKDIKLCHEKTKLNLSNAILKLSPSYGCDVTKSGHSTPQGTKQTKLQPTDDVTEGLTKRTTTKASTKITSTHATTRGIFVPTTTNPSEPQHRLSTQEKFDTNRATPTYRITPQKSTMEIKVSTQDLSTIHTTTPVLSTIHKSTPVRSTIYTTRPVITSTDDKYSTSHEATETTMKSTQNQMGMSQSTSNPETSTLFESTTQKSTTREYTPTGRESTTSSETTLDISALDSETTESDTTTVDFEDTTEGFTARSTVSSTTPQRSSTNFKTTALESTQKPQSTRKTFTTTTFVSTDKVLSTVATSTNRETSTTNENKLKTTAATKPESTSNAENIVLTTPRETTTGGHEPACQEGTLYNNSCYILHVNTLTLADAEKECQASGNNTRLVSLQDENETIFVTHLVNSSSVTSNLDFWIGLKNTKFKWIDGTYISYENFGLYTDEPEYCVFYDKLYFWPWVTTNCTIPLNFICEVFWYESSGNPDDCDLLEGNICYILEPVKEMFTNAFDHCENIGGKLLQLETFEEEDNVKAIIPNDGVWLGLHFTSGEQSEFVWSDRIFSPANYTNFGNYFGGFGKFCMHLDASDSFKWVDDNCENLKAFICEEKLE